MSFLREVPLDENEFPPFANSRRASGSSPSEPSISGRRTPGWTTAVASPCSPT